MELFTTEANGTYFKILPRNPLKTRKYFLCGFCFFVFFVDSVANWVLLKKILILTHQGDTTTRRGTWEWIKLFSGCGLP